MPINAGVPYFGGDASAASEQTPIKDDARP
jgi:hypothetical protein